MLSVVVIGRNESKNIVRVALSISLMKDRIGVPVQTIYVDSASLDGTPDIAEQYFDEIYILEDSKYLCAAAGRFVGTEKAKYDWVLYLDADMALCPEFIGEIERLIDSGSKNISGYIGNYIFIFNNGDISKVTFGDKNDGRAKTIGGCVLLKTKDVVMAGNWNPSVFSYEERELYSRLGKENKNIMYIDIPMIKHHTKYISKWKAITQSFFPNSGLGKKYYGFGQMIVASIINNSFVNVLKIWPEPFIYWGSLIIGFFLFISGKYIIAILQLLVVFVYLNFKTNRANLLLYLSLLPRFLLGMLKYSSTYRPIISSEINKKSSN